MRRQWRRAVSPTFATGSERRFDADRDGALLRRHNNRRLIGTDRPTVGAERARPAPIYHVRCAALITPALEGPRPDRRRARKQRPPPAVETRNCIGVIINSSVRQVARVDSLIWAREVPRVRPDTRLIEHQMDRFNSG